MPHPIIIPSAYALGGSHVRGDCACAPRWQQNRDQHNKRASASVRFLSHEVRARPNLVIKVQPPHTHLIDYDNYLVERRHTHHDHALARMDIETRAKFVPCLVCVCPLAVDQVPGEPCHVRGDPCGGGGVQGGHPHQDRQGQQRGQHSTPLQSSDSSS